MRVFQKCRNSPFQEFLCFSCLSYIGELRPRKFFQKVGTWPFETFVFGCFIFIVGEKNKYVAEEGGGDHEMHYGIGHIVIGCM